MYKSVDDIIEGLFFTTEGEIEPIILPIAAKIDFTGYQYRTKEGALYVANNESNAFSGIGDTEGNYIYVRFNGNHEIDQLVITPLRLVLVLPEIPDALNAGLFLVSFIKRNLGKYLSKIQPINSNKQEIFTEETGLATEKLKKEIGLIAIDFNVKHTLPKSCDEFSTNQQFVNK